MKGVPRTENRGVPNFHEGIDISRYGESLDSISSTVFGLCSSPGWVTTILKVPGSDSRAAVDPWMVESDKARRCPPMLFRLSSSSDCNGWVDGVEGT